MASKVFAPQKQLGQSQSHNVCDQRLMASKVFALGTLVAGLFWPYSDQRLMASKVFALKVLFN